MDISIELVKKDEQEILKNLLEKYHYEHSQYDDRDVNDLGLFGYEIKNDTEWVYEDGTIGYTLLFES